MTVNHSGSALSWSPGTFSYEWSTVTQVNDLAQVVDGRWAIDGDTIRPLVFDFDRLVALGDLSWRDYTVTVPVTVEAIDEGGYPAPSNGPGIGLMVRWNGHYDNDNGFEPRTGWRRLGAMAWYRWQRQSGVYTSGYQILRDGGQVAAENGQSLKFGTTYLFKLQVDSATSPATYRFKVWEQGATEPTGWMFTIDGKTSEPASGGVLLVAHHVDARFGPVTVELDSVQPAPQLTVPSVAGGGVQIDLQKASYRFGEDVVLTALPDAGTPFSGWSGDIYGTDEATTNDNPLVVSMFGHRTIQAQFESCSSNSAPTAAYTFAPAEPIAGEPVQFTDESTGCPNRWKWDFGDGTSCHRPEPGPHLCPSRRLYGQAHRLQRQRTRPRAADHHRAGTTRRRHLPRLPRHRADPAKRYTSAPRRQAVWAASASRRPTSLPMTRPQPHGRCSSTRLTLL